MTKEYYAKVVAEYINAYNTYNYFYIFEIIGKYKGKGYKKLKVKLKK